MCLWTSLIQPGWLACLCRLPQTIGKMSLSLKDSLPRRPLLFSQLLMELPPSPPSGRPLARVHRSLGTSSPRSAPSLRCCSLRRRTLTPGLLLKYCTDSPLPTAAPWVWKGQQQGVATFLETPPKHKIKLTLQEIWRSIN